jgi:hypothetical protein
MSKRPFSRSAIAHIKIPNIAEWVQYRVTCYIFLIGAFLYTLVVANPTNTFTPQDLKKKDL